jgi:hypothetical protein
LLIKATVVEMDTMVLRIEGVVVAVLERLD